MNFFSLLFVRKYLVIFLFISIFTPISLIAGASGGGGGGGASNDCTTLTPICTDVGLDFTAETGIPSASTTNPGNNYGCLFSQPNPTWYYIQVATGGNINMSLSAASDIDYIIYGPYSSLTTAQNDCGGYGAPAGEIESCSFSGTNMETPSITGAAAGTVYVMLITNYASIVQDVTLVQTSGSGSTDCNIVNPTCLITALTATPSGCNATNQYSVSGSVTVTSPPATGTLTVSSSCGGTQTFNAPFTSPIAYNLTGITPTGAACTVTATFSATACSLTQTYTSPTIPTVGAGLDQIVCSGSPITLTGTGATTYIWTGGITNGTAFVPAASGTYTVTGTNAAGCKNTDIVAVTVNPLATANAGADQTICAGGSVTLAGAFGGGATSGTWSATSGSFSSTTNMGATYTPTITTGTITLTLTTNDPAGPCLAVTDQVVITVNPVATANANVDQTVCVGGTITLAGAVGGSAGSGTWTAATGAFSSATNLASTYTPSITSGTVTLTLTTNDPAGPCAAVTDIMVVTVNPLATVNANIDQTVCAGGTITLAGTIGGAATSSNWSAGSGAFSLASSLTSTYTPSIASGTVTLTLTTNDPTGPCLAVTDVMIVTVNPLNTIAAGTSPSLCINTPLTTIALATTGATGVTFSGLPAGVTGSWAGNVATISGTPTVSGTFNYSVTTIGGCPPAIATGTITVNALPIVTANSPTVCAGVSITLSGGGASTYSWNNGVTNGTAFMPPSGLTTTTTPYTVTGTNTATGCTNTANSTVTVNPLPIVVANDTTICSNGTVAITASGANTYFWSPATYLSATTGPSVNFVNGLTTTYTVAGTSVAGCVGTDVLTVTVTPNAPINAGFDLTTCVGTPITITATGGVTYVWSPATFISATTGASITFTPGSTTIYTVTGTDAGGCTGTDQMTVTVNLLPTAIIAGTVTVCQGAPAQTITFTGAGATAPYTFTYSLNGGVNQTITSVGNAATVSVPTGTATTFTYSLVSVASANNCSQTQVGNAVVTITPLPTATISGTTSLCQNATSPNITFTGASGVAPYTFTYNINGGAAQTVTTSAGNSVTVSAPTGSVGTFVYNLVSVSSANTCSQAQVGTETVTIIPLPTATISGTSSVCQNAPVPSITFTGANGTAPYTFTYNINGGATQTVTSVGNSVTVSAPTSTVGSFVYNLVSVASSNACSQAQAGSATVTVNALPSPIINGASSYCAGQFSTLSTSVPFTTYLWSTGVSAPTANVTTANNPISVTVTNAQGCSAISSIFTVSVNSVITYNSSVSICQGQSVLIHGVSQNTAATYTQTYILATGCDSTSNVTLTVNPLPVIAVADQTVCEGTAVTLSGNGADTYTWTGVITNGVAFTPLTSGPYTVTGTNLATGCINTDLATITLNPLPTATVAGTASVCLNDVNPTITFTGANGTAPYTFTYTINGGANQTVTSVGNTATVSVSTSTAGAFAYTLGSVQDASSTACSQAQVGTATITVNPLPTATAAGTATVCLNDVNPTITFTGANGTSPYTFSYTINGGAVLTATSVGNTAIVSASTTTAGLFVYNLVSVQDASTTACSQAQVGSATITVDPLPTATIGGTTAVCQNAAAPSITFTGANSTAPYTFTYTINGGANQTVSTIGGSSSVTVNAATATAGTFTYSLVSVLSATTCSQAQVGIATITVNSLPTATITGASSVCINGTAPTLTFTGANGTAPYTFTYNINGGANQTVTSVGNTATVTAPSTVAGAFSYNIVSVSSTIGCSQAQVGSALITIIALPIVNAGNSFTLCDGQTATLTGSGATTYTWDNGVANGVTFTPSVGTLTYTVTGTSAFGCTNTDQLTILVNQLPAVSFMTGVTLGCVPLTTSLTNTSANSVNCVWTISNGDVLTGCGPLPATFNQPGCYDITLTTTDLNGCSNSFTSIDIVCTEANPIAAFSPSESIMSTNNTEVLFTNNSIGASDYSWDLGDNSPLTNDVNPIHTYLEQEGTYIVTLIATTPLGCADTAYATIQINEALLFYVPNTFTPDVDDYNPIFQPVFTSGFDPYDYTLLIFNRWGEIIFESHDATIGWNGSYGSNGEIVMCEDGTYTWKIEFKTKLNDERKMIVGHVNVIR